MAGKIRLPCDGGSAAAPSSLISFVHQFCHVNPLILAGLTVSQEGVKLPPEPPGQCSKELQVTNPFKSSKGHVTRHVASSFQLSLRAALFESLVGGQMPAST